MISNEKLIELYTAMVKCRLLTERAASLVRGARLTRDLQAGIGREATIAGVALDLLPRDTISTSSRDLASSCGRGLPVAKILQGLSARDKGPAHPTDQLREALSAAQAHKTANHGRVAVAFSQDGKPGQAKWRKSLAAASDGNLPLLFVCHGELVNGRGSASSPQAINARLPLALTFGVPSITVDANDVVAVYRVACESIARARQGRGPSLIECVPYAVASPHHTRKQSGQPATQDPIVIMETYLEAKGLFRADLKRKIETGFGRRLDRATGLTVD